MKLVKAALVMALGIAATAAAAHGQKDSCVGGPWIRDGPAA